MQIKLNGELREIDVDQTTLFDLISLYHIKKEAIIAEVNEVIVKKEEWSDCTIKDGDTVELITFMGGGR